MATPNLPANLLPLDARSITTPFLTRGRTGQIMPDQVQLG